MNLSWIKNVHTKTSTRKSNDIYTDVLPQAHDSFSYYLHNVKLQHPSIANLNGNMTVQYPHTTHKERIAQSASPYQVEENGFP